MNFLRTSYKLLMIFLWIPYKLCENFSWTSCELLTNFIQTSCKLSKTFLKTSYELLINFLWTSCELLTKFLWTSYKILVNFLWNSWEHLKLQCVQFYFCHFASQMYSNPRHIDVESTVLPLCSLFLSWIYVAFSGSVTRLGKILPLGYFKLNTLYIFYTDEMFKNMICCTYFNTQ